MGHRSVKTLSIYDTEQLHPHEHKQIQRILQGEKSETVLTNAGSVLSMRVAVPRNSVSSIPAALGAPSDVPVPLEGTMSQCVQNNVTASSSTAIQYALFSGAFIHNCVFNINTASSVPPNIPQ
jgi:hypothetical protein